MAKYSFEFKKEAVAAYLNGEGSYAFLTKKFQMPPGKDTRKWVNAYKAFGDEGLTRPRANKCYSFDFKMRIVELYLTTEVSYQGLALSEGINNPATLTKWVIDFRIAGPDALRPRKKGRGKALKSFELTDSDKSMQRNADVAYVKQLEDGLLKLKIENAYLKELRRLRLEGGTLLKKQRESSTASGESPN